MPATPDRKVSGALTRDQFSTRGVKPDDVKPDWMDKMVKRLFSELQKQLARIEATKPDDNDTKCASVRAANVRTLSSIEQTLERLARLEQQRVAKRQTKMVVRKDELRASIQHKIDILLKHQEADRTAEETGK
jgi:hypothetical protein